MAESPVGALREICGVDSFNDQSVRALKMSSARSSSNIVSKHIAGGSPKHTVPDRLAGTTLYYYLIQLYLSFSAFGIYQDTLSWQLRSLIKVKGKGWISPPPCNIPRSFMASCVPSFQ